MTGTEDKVITWNEVHYFINSGELYKLKRSQEETKKYHEHKRHLKENNIDMAEYLLGKLGWDDKMLSKLNSKEYPTDDLKINASFTDKSLFKLTLNDFPYQFESDVIHLLIWSKIRLPIYVNDTTAITMDRNALPEMHVPMKKRIDLFISQNLERYNIEPQDYVWFINYSSLQSIKSISHIHLLIKLKTHNTSEIRHSLLTDFEPLQ